MICREAAIQSLEERVKEHPELKQPRCVDSEGNEHINPAHHNPESDTGLGFGARETQVEFCHCHFLVSQPSASHLSSVFTKLLLTELS